MKPFFRHIYLRLICEYETIMKTSSSLNLPIGNGDICSLLPIGYGQQPQGEENGCYIFNKRRVDILFPKEEDISIDDIGRALSNTCRYNGHTSQFYSVAQHSVIVSHITEAIIKENTKYGYFSDVIALRALLHDAHEAYLGDMIRPMKNIANISSFIEELESRWDEVILSCLMPGIDEYKELLPGVIDEWEEVDQHIPQIEMALYLDAKGWDDSHPVFKEPFCSVNLSPDLFAYQSPENSFHAFMGKYKALSTAIIDRKGSVS